MVYSCFDQIRNLEFCFCPFLKVHETVNGGLITLFEVSSRSGAIEVMDAGDSHGLEDYGQVSACFGVEGWNCLSFV